MNGEQITAFLQAHWEWVTLIMGIVSVAGSILNWNWMCDPISDRNAGTVRLYEKKGGRWILMDDIHAEHGGCEYVEYSKGQSRAAVPSVRYGGI